MQLEPSSLVGVAIACSLQDTLRGRLLAAVMARSPVSLWKGSYLVDPASSHMLVSKIKPCMSKYKLLIL